MIRRIAKHALKTYATRLPCQPWKWRVMPQGVAKLGSGGECCDLNCRAA